MLLHLYADRGVSMLSALRGMFAFALWDAEKRALLLARDLYGIKPLYTANDGWTFRFASQVKALMAPGRVSRDPEPAGLVGFNLFGSVPEPFTIYRDVRALPAGHFQWIDATGPREPQAYDSVAHILAAGYRASAARREPDECVRTAVADSVRAHLVADVEVGIFLSAGVDSSALLGLVRDAGQIGIRAITLAFDEFRGTSEDEVPLAARTAQRYGAQHVVRSVSEREFRDDLPAIISAMDQPSIDGVNTWFVAKAAREVGLKVALSGTGGDELLAGYPSFIDVPRWRRRIGPLAVMPGLGKFVRICGSAMFPDVAERNPKIFGLLEYADSWAGAYLLRRGLFLPHDLGRLMDRDLMRQGLRRLAPLKRLASLLTPDPGSDVGRVCALESAHYLRNQLLRDADWAGMAHGVEIRVPLVDTELVRTLAPLVARMKPGIGKAALASAPSLPLPSGIVQRAKTGFGVPTAAWLGRAAGLSPDRTGAQSKGVVARRWSRVVLDGVPVPGHAAAL
jgi:asparagine synthase (glutamine-hydrolysing)